MKYLNQYHKEKTERCRLKMRTWRKLPMTSEEQLKAAEEMKQNMAKGIEMERA